MIAWGLDVRDREREREGGKETGRQTSERDSVMLIKTRFKDEEGRE